MTPFDFLFSILRDLVNIDITTFNDMRDRANNSWENLSEDNFLKKIFSSPYAAIILPVLLVLSPIIVKKVKSLLSNGEEDAEYNEALRIISERHAQK